jgi:hypothetical protein
MQLRATSSAENLIGWSGVILEALDDREDDALDAVVRCAEP